MKRPKSVFIDTSFVQALFSKDDAHYDKAQQLLPLLSVYKKVWITEAILLEIGDAFSSKNRTSATEFINYCYQSAHIEVVNVTTEIVGKAVDLYDKRPDKTWGLVDCVSFVVMKENRIKEALTSDKHFVQAGFQELLLD
jgi:uncharacterized protein